MSTRTKIKLINDGIVIGAVYYPMDGHLWRFAPELVKILESTTPTGILQNKQLLQFLCQAELSDYGDSFLSYLCEVDVTQNGYLITVYDYKKEKIFSGSLDGFAAKFVSM